jgi:hypothetical protein
MDDSPKTPYQNVSPIAVLQRQKLDGRDKRIQPWKAFCDPCSPDNKPRIDAAPTQKLFNVGDAALTQYAAENE